MEKVIRDTICAAATPQGRSALAVVRLTGPESAGIAALHLGDGVLEAEHGRQTLTRLKLPDGTELDRVTYVVLHEPDSYTGEQMVEITCHGNPLIVQMLLGSLCESGARIAEPGEFTRRAFLNSKFDLTRAEGVREVIEARSDRALKAALDLEGGRIAKELTRIREKLIELLARIEVVIDYPDEDVPEIEPMQILEALEPVEEDLEKLIRSWHYGRLLSEGLKVAIIGRPNVGKSSLLNALLSYDRAIVTDIPGTTRDEIEASVELDGHLVTFVDTAGIRHTDDEVEMLGVERSIERVKKSDLVLAVFDYGEDLAEEDYSMLKIFHEEDFIIVLNKADLVRQFDTRELNELLGGMGRKGQSYFRTVCVGEPQGIEELKAGILEFITGHDHGWERVVTSSRIRHGLKKAAGALYDTRAEAFNVPVDILATNIREAAEQLGMLTGETVTEEVLEKMFSTFCVGK